MAKLEALGFFMSLLRIQYTIKQNGVSEENLHTVVHQISSLIGTVKSAMKRDFAKCDVNK